MKQANSTMAQQIAEAASTFEHLRTGHGPKSVERPNNHEHGAQRC